MRQRAEERRRMVEQRMRDKNRRQIKDVYRHLRSAQRCLVLAGKVFQRYEVSPSDSLCGEFYSTWCFPAKQRMLCVWSVFQYMVFSPLESLCSPR